MSIFSSITRMHKRSCHTNIHPRSNTRCHSLYRRHRPSWELTLISLLCRKRCISSADSWYFASGTAWLSKTSQESKAQSLRWTSVVQLEAAPLPWLGHSNRLLVWIAQHISLSLHRSARGLCVILLAPCCLCPAHSQALPHGKGPSLPSPASCQGQDSLDVLVCGHPQASLG